MRHSADKSEGSVPDIVDINSTPDLEARGQAHYSRLGWKRFTVVLIVEAIALGCLCLPHAFAALGMVLGTVISVFIGLVAIYTSYIVGQVKLKYPTVSHYADAGRLLMGSFGYELIGAMFVLQLVFLVGSHCLTGAIAFLNITGSSICSIMFGFVSAVILLLLAVPPSFAEVAILGYIDFASIVLAVVITIVATGIQASQGRAGAGLGEAHRGWSAWPRPGLTFADAFIAVTGIVFAYSFAVCQFSFMDEMHTPQDFVKAIWALGLTEIFIYTFTGAVVYAFVGMDVQSPALLSAGPVMSKVVFAIALPVIFISGSINTTVVGRYIHGRVYKDSVVRYINTPKGWGTWLGLITLVTVLAWLIAEAIPFFGDLLAISSALFVSGFTFYFPAWMWFKLIKEGKWNGSRHNIALSIVNALIFLLGIVVLVCGTYSTVLDIQVHYKRGTLRAPFTCTLK